MPEAFATANNTPPPKPNNWHNGLYDRSVSPPVPIVGTQGDYVWQKIILKNSAFNGFPFPILENYWDYESQSFKPITVWDGASNIKDRPVVTDNEVGDFPTVVGPGTPYCVEFNSFEDIFDYYWRVAGLELTSGRVSSEASNVGYGYWSPHSSRTTSITLDASQYPIRGIRRPQNIMGSTSFPTPIVPGGYCSYINASNNVVFPDYENEICGTDNWDTNYGGYSDCGSVSGGFSIHNDFIKQDAPDQSFPTASFTGHDPGDNCYQVNWDDTWGSGGIGVPYIHFNPGIAKVNGKYYARLGDGPGLEHKAGMERHSFVKTAFFGRNTTVIADDFPSGLNLIQPTGLIEGSYLYGSQYSDDIEHQRFYFIAYSYGLSDFLNDLAAWGAFKGQLKTVTFNFNAFGKQIATARVPFLVLTAGHSGADANPQISDTFTINAFKYFIYTNSKGEQVYNTETGEQINDVL